KNLPTAPRLESEYARSKRKALLEVVQPIQARGLAVVVVCPGALYGPGESSARGRLLRRYALRRLPAMVGAEAEFNWVHVADAAAGHRLAATNGRPGETYFMGGDPMSYQDLFRTAERITGLPAPRLWIPGRFARLAARALGRVRPSLSEALRGLGGAIHLA